MRRLLLALFAGTAACSEPAGPPLADPCPGSFEGFAGLCARVVLILETPEEPWPEVSWHARIRPVADELRSDGADSFGLWRESRPVPYVDVIWPNHDLRALPDTASASIVVTMYEVVRPIESGAQYAIFATDSVVRTLRFFARGSIPVPDTIHMRLR